jgi:hypothetical protein
MPVARASTSTPSGSSPAPRRRPRPWIGESFDGYHAADRHDAGASQAGSVAAPDVGHADSAVATAPAEAIDRSEDDDAGTPSLRGAATPLGKHCDGSPADEVRFNAADELDEWSVISSQTPTPVAPLAYVSEEGSPQRGAAAFSPQFSGPNQSVKVGIRGLTPRALECVSIRVKIVDKPGNPNLANERAGWLLWAVDRTGCYAQAEIGRPPWFHYELAQAGTWYELGYMARELEPNGCKVFDPGQVARVGIGVVSASLDPWDATFLIDTLRLY